MLNSACANNDMDYNPSIKTTYIITVRAPQSILMASDTRLNYFHDIKIDGVLHQKISAIADCIRKTFYISSAQIGINFVGIGYFSDPQENNNHKYPLQYFINKLNCKDISGNIENKFNFVFNYFTSLSDSRNTGQYVKGVMLYYANDSSYVCLFNTYDKTMIINEFQVGHFIDSEGNKDSFPHSREDIITEINSRINKKSTEKPYSIGGPIEILEIFSDGSHSYIQKNERIFNGTNQELINYFNSDINKLNGKIINPPVIQKYDFMK